MPPALESEPLCTIFIYFLPPVTYFYSEIIVTVIFSHVCLLIPEAQPEGAALAIA